MRLPHHLKTASNGVYYFRLAVPAALRTQLGKTEVVCSLRTRDPTAAKLMAYGLSAKYLAEFRHAMKKNPPSLLEAIEAAKQGSTYTITLPNGLTISADGPEDHDRAVQAIGRLDQLGALKAQPAPSAPTGVEFKGSAEVGPLFSFRNDVRVPGDGGTRFELDGLTGEGPEAFGRLAIERTQGRHGWRAVYQPLRTDGVGRLLEVTDFAGAQFSPTEDTRGRYQFDTWRFSYRYLWRDRETFRLWVGATGLVRDAEIALRQGATRARDSNVGFVPLLHALADWKLTPTWRVQVEADALAAPQGRAIDLGVRSVHALNQHWAVSANLRMLEGGADNDSVYTFGWCGSATVGLSRSF